MPSAKHQVEALEILRCVQGPTLAHPGCTSSRICLEDGAEHAVVLWEEWTSNAAFQEYVRSDLYRRILAALELSSQTPEVCIYEVSTTQGMDLIERLRSVAHPEPDHLNCE